LRYSTSTATSLVTVARKTSVEVGVIVRHSLKLAITGPLVPLYLGNEYRLPTLTVAALLGTMKRRQRKMREWPGIERQQCGYSTS